MRKRIIKKLEDGPLTNKELRIGLGLAKTKADPRLDRTLQGMRRAGLVEVVDRRWYGSTIRVCPECEGRGWTHAKPAAPPSPQELLSVEE